MFSHPFWKFQRLKQSSRSLVLCFNLLAHWKFWRQILQCLSSSVPPETFIQIHVHLCTAKVKWELWLMCFWYHFFIFNILSMSGTHSRPSSIEFHLCPLENTVYFLLWLILWIFLTLGLSSDLTWLFPMTWLCWEYDYDYFDRIFRTQEIHFLQPKFVFLELDIQFLFS